MRVTGVLTLLLHRQAIGMATIERHVAALTRHLFRSLKALRHRNEAPFVLLYWGRKEDPSGMTFSCMRGC